MSLDCKDVEMGAKSTEESLVPEDRELSDSTTTYSMDSSMRESDIRESINISKYIVGVGGESSQPRFVTFSNNAKARSYFYNSSYRFATEVVAVVVSDLFLSGVLIFNYSFALGVYTDLDYVMIFTMMWYRPRSHGV
jgi:hypothetical protein